MSQTHSTQWTLVWRALVAVTVFVSCDGQDGGGGGIDVEERPDTSGSEVIDVSFPDTTTDTADASGDAEPDTGPPCPGCFGAPCETNSQCNSGYCVPGPDGSVCTQTCVESCPTDWSCRPLSTGGGDPVFLCLYDHLSHCAPCRQDSDCVDPLNPFGRVRCLEGDAEGRERFCASPCQSDGDCPAGNACEQSDEGRFCAPVSGVCECSPWAALTGAETDCINSNDFGVCAGVRRCGEDGLSTCLGPQASEEVCNGVDDDCDGQEDESFPDQGLACDGDDEDVCDDDVLTCFDGSLVCVDAGGPPNIEVCDGADNDCDGFIDADDQDLVRVACDVVAGVCEGAQRPAELCVEGAWLACDNQHYEAHTGSFEAGEESRCDGLDNDCDGVADEDFHFVDGDDQTVSGVGSTCGVGGCSGGVTRCNDAGTGLVCSTDGLVQAERCNGVDDDCDGLVDTFDSNLLTATCENQQGVCLGSTKLASLCIDGSWAGCVTANYALHADTYETDAELSCDALDNDCDGRTDEDFEITMPDGQVAKVGASCGTGLCAGGVAQCNAAFPERGLVCTTASNARPEVCNGLDDDCDGLIDGADPDLARPLCEEQRGVCTGARKPASLCGAVTAGEWASCTVTEYRAHAASHNPTELACDGSDNDCDGRVDEDFALAMPDGATVMGVGSSCGVGGCAGGTLRCAADRISVECSSLGSVQAEVCDNVDNDCDGRVDAIDSDLVRVPCGTEEGVCFGALALPNRCVDGAWQACGPSDFVAHSESYAQVEARCDGVDEDCDGRIDDDFSIVLPSGVTVVGAHRNCGEGACTGGVTVCNAGGDGLVCDRGVLASPEVCDGEDNDCDGLVDGDDPDMARPRCDEQRGVCNGARRPPALCVGGAWAACSASTFAAHDGRYDDGVEVRCDGVDNDCDGASDEDFTVGGVDGVGRSCGVGACAGGVTVCNGAGDGTVCPGDNNTSTEVCDGIDNDCDGLVDGADPDLVLPLCENQSGVCANATKTPAMCVDGRFIACGEGDYATHSELFEAGAETRCDGADNDCDGRFDEDFSLVDLNGAAVSGAGTSCGVGVCAGGVAVCNAAGSGLVCSSHVAVSNEVCDAVDNDCDGRLDAVDASLVRVACAKQGGVCAGAISPASLCVDGAWQACTSDVYAAFDGRYQWPLEGACDGLDNDCDGAADDDFAYTQRDGRSVSGVGTACGVGNCAGGTLVCAPSGNGVTCPGEAAASGERCDAEDNDCDGFLDAADTDMQVVPCERQGGVCANAMKPPTLCVAGAWAACGAVVYGAFSSRFEAGSEVSCDGLDNDCDGIFDEDFATTTPDGSVVVGVGASCGVGRCAGGVTTCNAGGNGTWCPSTTSIVVEACNGQDDDCDGRVDAADVDLVRVACDQQRGACAGAMRPAARCVAGAWQACLAVDYTAHDGRYDNGVEVRCDGVDNDCNGAVDEDFVFVDPGGQSSTVGGSCGRGLCAGGTTVCAAGGQALTCSTAVSAGGEICDGLDQDCDGVVDDGCDDDGDDYCDTAFAVLGRPEVCGLGGGDCNDADAGIRPNANETCDSRDEDCDGGVDESYVDCERARCEARGDGTFAARVTEGCAAGGLCAGDGGRVWALCVCRGRVRECVCDRLGLRRGSPLRRTGGSVCAGSE